MQLYVSIYFALFKSEQTFLTPYIYLILNRFSIGRHSKSLDIERKRCGYCMGKFEVYINKTRGDQAVRTPIQQKKEATGFAKYVKENYANMKQPNLAHSDVMKLLGKKFAELKVQNKG